MNLEKHINSIPLWRRIAICIIEWKAWRVAKAYNVVTVDQLHGGDWHLGDRLKKISGHKWAAVYGVDMPPLEKPEDYEKRAIRAEMDLITERHNIAKLERENALLKNTMRALKDHRRTRSLSLSNNQISSPH